MVVPIRSIVFATTLVFAACSRTKTPATVSTLALKAETRDQCRACNGEWGLHGLAQTEGCLCRTRDKGKRCTDGDECQGDCVGSGEVEVTDKGPPRRGFHVGRCSEFTTTFGCYARIEKGARKAGPVSIDESSTQICVD